MDITSNRHYEVSLNLRVAARPPIPAGITEDRLSFPLGMPVCLVAVKMTGISVL